MKICLTGSTRFIELYQEINRKLTLMGHLVYTVAYTTSQHRGDDITPEQKEILDLVHLRKIQESDAVVLITDETGYYGDSTRRELTWAQLIEKPIYGIHQIDSWIGSVFESIEIQRATGSRT